MAYTGNYRRNTTAAATRPGRGGTTGFRRGTQPPARGGRRGTGRTTGPRSVMLGVLSICCFPAYWLMIALTWGMLMKAAQDQSMSGVAGAGVVALLSFLVPLVGIGLGIAGLAVKRSNKVLAGIGLGLNVVVLVLWLALRASAANAAG